jgi:hypothetical protein
MQHAWLMRATIQPHIPLEGSNAAAGILHHSSRGLCWAMVRASPATPKNPTLLPTGSPV